MSPQHGTLSGYTNLKCRCAPCRAANAAWQRGYKRRLREGGPIRRYRKPGQAPAPRKPRSRGRGRPSGLTSAAARDARIEAARVEREAKRHRDQQRRQAQREAERERRRKKKEAAHAREVAAKKARGRTSHWWDEKLDAAPLRDMLRREAASIGIVNVAAACGVSARRIDIVIRGYYYRSGRRYEYRFVTMRLVDAWCVALGYHPIEIYPDQY